MALWSKAYSISHCVVVVVQTSVVSTPWSTFQKKTSWSRLALRALHCSMIGQPTSTSYPPHSYLLMCISELLSPRFYHLCSDVLHQLVLAVHDSFTDSSSRWTSWSRGKLLTQDMRQPDNCRPIRIRPGAGNRHEMRPNGLRGPLQQQHPIPRVLAA